MKPFAFAELLARRKIGNVDLIFASEALNLAELLRLRPELAGRPSVVYFHDNQLPDPSQPPRDQEPTDLVGIERLGKVLEDCRRLDERVSIMLQHRDLTPARKVAKLRGPVHPSLKADITEAEADAAQAQHQRDLVRVERMRAAVQDKRVAHRQHLLDYALPVSARYSLKTREATSIDSRMIGTPI